MKISHGVDERTEPMVQTQNSVSCIKFFYFLCVCMPICFQSHSTMMLISNSVVVVFSPLHNMHTENNVWYSGHRVSICLQFLFQYL